MHLGGSAMQLTKYKLGDLIRQRREKHDGSQGLPIRGVSRDGLIFPKQEDADTSIYNVFYKNDFVFNPARMELNSIALNTVFEKATCSSLYEIFYITREDIVLPLYLNMYIKRDEFARKCWFEAIGSARNYFRVPALSEFEIYLPPIPIQQKYVDLYEAMLQNQQSYERGLEDLKLACEAVIDKAKREFAHVNLGELFDVVDKRNIGGVYTSPQGINITKDFMPTVASIDDGSLTNYKIVAPGQFAYSSMQTGRDKCIRIALHHGSTPIIVSPAYAVLQSKPEKVVPEYLMLWFSRQETDRMGWFASDASIRSNLDLERFLEFTIPLPEIPQQQALSNLYDTYVKRRDVNEQLKAQIKNICPILIKGSLEEGAAS